MWWLGHLILIVLIFGFGVAWRELFRSYKALEQWFIYGSEDPAEVDKPKAVVTSPLQADTAEGSQVVKPSAFINMQAKADNDKLAELKSALMRKQ